jgi:hypothetical protein
VVARLDDARLEIVQAREAKRTVAGRRRGAAAGTTASRRSRVERSRQRASGLKEGATTETTTPQGLADVGEGLPAGAHAPLADDAMPEGFEIKGNADSMLYHLPGTSFYNRTVAEIWFDTAENAEAAGYQLPKSQRHDAEEDAADEETTDEDKTLITGGEGSASDEPQAAPRPEAAQQPGESEADDEPATSAEGDA